MVQKQGSRVVDNSDLVIITADDRIVHILCGGVLGLLLSLYQLTGQQLTGHYCRAGLEDVCMDLGKWKHYNGPVTIKEHKSNAFQWPHH